MTSSLHRILAGMLRRSSRVGFVALAWSGPVLAQGAVLGLPGTLRDADLAGAGPVATLESPLTMPRITGGRGAESDGARGLGTDPGTAKAPGRGGLQEDERRP